MDTFIPPDDLNLIIDIGNTRTKAAFFNGNQLGAVRSFSQGDRTELLAFSQENQVDACIVCSVSESAQSVLDDIKIPGIELTHKTPLPFTSLYKTPETLGKDRLANAAGAIALYPQKNVLAIDMGTCIKYDLVTAKGEYAGGAISPGFEMRYQALNHFTERLPLLEKELRSTRITGESTETAMKSGVYYGTLFEIEGYIKHYKQELGELTVILTGGQASFFENALKNSIFAHPFLTLIGLNAILEHDKKMH